MIKLKIKYRTVPSTCWQRCFYLGGECVLLMRVNVGGIPAEQRFWHYADALLSARQTHQSQILKTGEKLVFTLTLLVTTMLA